MLVIGTFLVNSAFNFTLGLLIASFLGPENFGRYAIAAAFAVVLNTIMLDWIRLAATRFYSERTREDRPEVRGTLDALFVLSSVGVILVSGTAILLGADFELSVGLAALAPAMAIGNGLFDYHTALVRARFEERTYCLLVILKNAFALVLLVGGAWWFRSPEAVAIGFVVGLIATLLIARRRLIDPGVRMQTPDWRAARRYLVYGFPLIAATAIYFLIPFWNRTAIAASLGLASTGHFSLAYDMTIRTVQTIGSALDIFLFQLALKAEHEHGPVAAQQQLSLNIGIVFAAMVAVSLGFWLLLPSFEAVLVPEAFRGHFSAVAATLLPGVVAYTLIQAAVTPIFQLKRRTWLALPAALAALGFNVLLVSRLDSSAAISDYAAAQVAGYGVALVVAVVLAFRLLPVLPRARDVAGTLLAAAAMTAVVWPIRASGPGWTTLGLTAGLGATAFLAVAFAADIGRCRILLRRFRPREQA